ncbi:Uncharacterized protein Fot_18321 [Forsythia ovata]|uniref:Uncharacterized protein n=1 Tax=Forsythia ovata TaxID=205694 RepID=A0ABD1VKK1_9LAMI
MYDFLEISSAHRLSSLSTGTLSDDLPQIPFFLSIFADNKNELQARSEWKGSAHPFLVGGSEAGKVYVQLLIYIVQLLQARSEWKGLAMYMMEEHFENINKNK